LDVNYSNLDLWISLRAGFNHKSFKKSKYTIISNGCIFACDVRGHRTEPKYAILCNLQ